MLDAEDKCGRRVKKCCRHVPSSETSQLVITLSKRLFLHNDVNAKRKGVAS